MPLRLRLPENFCAERPSDFGHVSITGDDPHTF
jgi:hypothetical protein